MIKQNQPTIFGHKLKICLSSVEDGNFGFKHGLANEVEANINQFLIKNDFNPELVTKFNTNYDKTDFCQYKIVKSEQKGWGIINQKTIYADGLVADKSDQALFYIVGDCCLVVLFDPKKSVLMLVHQGRHNAEQFGIKKAIEFLQQKFSVEPQDLLVWLSPAVGADTYPVFKRNNLSLQQIAKQDALSTGVLSENIEVCSVDTAKIQHYFSHSQYLKGRRKTNGRFGVVVQII